MRAGPGSRGRPILDRGRFYDAAGTPSWEKLRVPVELIDSTGRVVASVVPDQWGEFRFAQVRPATYTHRTYTRTLTLDSRRVAWEVLVDIDPYTNTPSYERVVRHQHCPGRACARGDR